MENNEAEEKTEGQIMDHEKRLWELSDSIQHNKICTIGVPEEEVREKGAEGLFEKIIAKNFPNLGKETDIQSRRYRELPSKSTKTD